MGYTIKIGNAVPVFDKTDFPYLNAEWEVEGIALEDAPTFSNDEMTRNGNGRSPSYSTWADFCRSTNLYDTLFDENGRLIGGHPGCIGISKETADKIHQERIAYEAKATLPPGFEEWGYDGEQQYDYHLARIIWLDWWVQWAITNCETPAISNT